MGLDIWEEAKRLLRESELNKEPKDVDWVRVSATVVRRGSVVKTRVVKTTSRQTRAMKH